MLKEILSTHFLLLWMTHKELNQSPSAVKKSSDINKVFLLYKELSTILSADCVCGHIAYIVNAGTEEKVTHMQVKKIIKEYDIVEHDDYEIDRLAKAKDLYHKLMTTLTNTNAVLEIVLKDIVPVS